MAYSGHRVIKKNIKDTKLIIDILKNSIDNFEYCMDTSGKYYDSDREDEIEALREDVEGEAIGHITDARNLLNDILERYGAK